MNLDMPEIREIKNELSDMRELVEFALSGSQAKLTITVKEIATKEGVSVSSLCPSGKCAYLLPRFGESGYPDGPRRWDLFEYWNWRKIPAAERKRMWQEHLRLIREKNASSRKGSA